MKIAVASDNNRVSGHFGHCESFILFDAKAGEIISQKVLPNPGHKPGFLPRYLNDQGIQVIISGGMGGAAVQIFNEHNIEVVIGSAGESSIAAKAYLSGDLKSTGSVCHEHQHNCE